MSTDSPRSSPLPAFYSSAGGFSTPLVVLAYAAVATVIAGFAAPAAGLAVFVLGLMTALSLTFVDWRRSEGSDRLDRGEFVGGESRSGVSYLSDPAERSTRAYLRNAQLRIHAAQTETKRSTAEPKPPLTEPEPSATEAAVAHTLDPSRVTALGSMERGARTGSPQLTAATHISKTPSAA